MRWFLAGLMFAGLVALAIFTATVRAENVIRRHALEQRYIAVCDRQVERERLEAWLLDRESSERLARAIWREVEAEALRRRENMQ
ncbi:MAG: hypothetical protein KDE27_07650 [Planctomycetes bacterium]|nr:hypothetical protein [Planctomycetota bacterium]